MIEPIPMPNETVFSWVTRYHLCVGVAPERNTYQALFDKERVRIHAYLPCGLKCLAKHGRMSANQWLNERTLYPLFKFFGHDDDAKLSKAMLTVQGCAISHAHTPHAKLNFRYGHKICPLCAKESLARIGFAYYEIHFQIPGVEVCPKHGCYLNYVSCGDYGLDRHLSLPREFQVIDCHNDLLIQFAQFCFDVFDLCTAYDTAEAMFFRYQNELSEKGFITKLHHIRMQLLIDTLSDYYRDFPFENGWETLSDFHFLGRLLWNKSRSRCHPAKHLLFAFWLFEGDASRYQLALSAPTKPPLKSSSADPVKDDVIALLKSGVSMEQISLQTGKSRCYIRRRAELEGVAHKTNYNAFDVTTRHSVLIQAKLGVHRQVIADDLNVGIGYVEQVICNTPGLSVWRKELVLFKKVCLSADELNQAKFVHPNWLRKEFKTYHSKAFFCLYHHDRASLESILPAKAKPHVVKHDWSCEDERLYQAICSLEGISKMSFTAIAESVHDRGHLRKKVAYLPKTKALLMRLGKMS